MPNEMFGTPTGTRLAEQDRMARQINSLQIQQTMGELAAQPVRARLLEAQTQAAEIEVDTAKRIQQYQQQLMSQRRAAEAGKALPITMENLSMQARTAAQTAFDMGLFSKGIELTKEASLIESHRSAAANSKSNRALHEWELRSKQVDRYLGFVASAKDQQSWESAVRMYENELGGPSDFRVPNANGERTADSPIVPWTPQITERLSHLLLSTKDRIDLELKKSQADDLKKFRESANALRKQREALVKAQIEEAKARTEKTRQELGGKTPVASTRIITAVGDRIKLDFPDLLPEEIRIFAHPIAERAVELKNKNRALRESEAAAMAYKEAMEANAGALGMFRMKGMPSLKEIEEQKLLVQKHMQEYNPLFEYKEVQTAEGPQLAYRRRKLPYE